MTEGGKLIVWDVAAGKVKARYAAHAGSAEAIAVTPDGQTAISTGIDGRVALWNLAGSGLLRPVPLRRPFDVDDRPSRRGASRSVPTAARSRSPSATAPSISSTP